VSSLKKLAQQTALYGISNVVGRLLNFLLVPLYVRLFAPEDYGIVTELYSYVALLNVIYTYGTETSFFRFSHESPEVSKSVYPTLFASLFVSSCLFSGVLWLASDVLANWMNYPDKGHYIRWFSLILAFDALASIPFSQLRQLQKPLLFAGLKLLNIGMVIGLNLFLLVYAPKNGISMSASFQGVDAVFFSNLIANGITLLLLLPWFPKMWNLLNWELWKKMMRYSWPLLFVGLAFVVNEAMDRMLLKYWIHAENPERELGIYGAVYKLAMFMTLYTQSFRMGAEPFFHQRFRKEGNTEIFGHIGYAFLLVGLGFFLVVVGFREEIGRAFLGKTHPEYLEGLTVVPLLFLANLCLGMYYNFSVWYRLADQNRKGMWMSIGGAGITILGNALLIPIFGYVGAGMTTLLCYGSMMLGSYWWGQRIFPIHYPIQKMIMAAAVVLCIWGIMELNPQIWARISGIGIALVYLGWNLKKSLQSS
jgi:O-antigen/teichoic acid export membrane protein